MLPYVSIATRNLRQAPVRSLFLGTALGIVTTLLVLLLSLSQGISETMIQAATTLAAGHVNVSGWFKARSSDAAPIVTKEKEVRAIVEAHTPGLDFVVSRHRGWGRVLSDTASIQSGLVGVEAKSEPKLLEVLRMAPERLYKKDGGDRIVGDPRRLAEPRTALLFAGQAKRLEAEVGDALTIAIETFSGTRNTIEVTVVAIAQDIGFMSNWNVFVDKETLREVYRMSPEVTGALMVYLKDPEQSASVLEGLRKVLEEKGYGMMPYDPQVFWMKFEGIASEPWVGQKLDLTIWKDEISFVTWVISAVDGVSFFLVAILAVIITVGIMNSMWIAVRERTSEIGTLRAIGMQKDRVLAMFLTEAMVLGFFGTLVGAGLGVVIAETVDAAKIVVPFDAIQMILLSDTLHLSVRPMHVVVAVLVFTMVSGLSALWPALRAAKLDPVTAIQRV